MVGYARVSITPDAPVPLDGYGNNQLRTTNHVLDELYATCIAFRSGEETILWFSQDLLSAKAILIHQAMERIIARTGVPEDHIFLCCTHTYSGPAVYEDTPGIRAFLEKYWNSVAEAAEKPLRIWYLPVYTVLLPFWKASKTHTCTSSPIPFILLPVW